MHPVKDQGSCGSCWAFAGTLALESMQAIEDATSAVRLSEQQGVDCTTHTAENLALFGETYGTAGCNGGWMSYYWNFSRDQGSMLNADYEYTAVDGDCLHDDSKIAVRAGEAGQVTGSVSNAEDQI